MRGGWLDGTIDPYVAGVFPVASRGLFHGECMCCHEHKTVFGQKLLLCKTCRDMGHDFWCSRCRTAKSPVESSPLQEDAPDFFDLPLDVERDLDMQLSTIDCDEEELSRRMEKVPFPPISGVLDFTQRAWMLGIFTKWFNPYELIAAMALMMQLERWRAGGAKV